MLSERQLRLYKNLSFTHSRTAQSMRSAAPLLLLFILALSDAAECQSFPEFKRKHILPTQFKTKDIRAWRKHLLKNKLCERTETQSFIKSSEENIKQICNGSGEKKNNYTKSTDLFEVYIVKSSKGIEPKCIVENCTSGKYNVIVKCEMYLPVHYHGQYIDMNTSPQPCF
ncbi:hypothetical protein G5714_004538 [Onychostoma macrolepis]|uniref:Ribonuclease A-domain domain-containing protein n=1 Tax=Onychostoma macrolepis TaxID=369639 RepID=A0A7J6D5G5_9TELE|nr:hypothetical protein G5714_004538 [Onychostoma macrolepis]